MSYKINNIFVSSGNITFPRIGAFYASVVIQNTESAQKLLPDQSVTFSIDGSVFNMTVILNAQNGFDKRTINLVGGGGTLSNESTPRNQVGPSFQVIATELMKDATRDVLAPFPSALIGSLTTSWQSAQGLSVGSQLTSLTEQFGHVWRLTSEGLIEFVSSDFSQTIILPEKSQHVQTFPSGTELYEVQEFDVIPTPGTLTETGTNIEEVEINFDSVTSTMALRAKGISGAIREAIDGEKNDKVFERSYAGTVSSQSGQKLKITPDDETLKGTGIDAVPMTLGLPGCTVQVSSGTKIRFCYDAANPSQPRICGFETGNGGGDLLVTIGDSASAQFAALSNLVNANFSSLQTYLDSHTHTSAAPSSPTSPPVLPSPTPTDVACKKLKIE